MVTKQVDQRFLGIQSKRPVSLMKEIVPCNNSLLVSAGKSLQPYNNIWVKSSFEGLVKPSGLIKGRALSRRALL